MSSATFIREFNNSIFFPESTWFQDPALVITKHLQIQAARVRIEKSNPIKTLNQLFTTHITGHNIESSNR